MKKLLYFAVAALAFVACAKEMTPEKEVVKETPKVKVSIKAVLAQEPETKAEIDKTNGNGAWELNDAIAVHTKKGKLATLKAESAGASVTFSGEIDGDDEIELGAIAYYPAAIATEGDASKVILPTSYESATAAEKGFLLRGMLTGDAVEFKHIGALLKVSINNVPSSVTKVEFSAASKAITGQLDVTRGENPGETDPYYCSAGAVNQEKTNRTITIATAAADRPTEGATVFYIPLPVGTYSNGFSIILKNEENVVATKTSTSSVEIVRAKVVKMKAMTPDAVDASGWFITGLFNGWNTTATSMTAVEGHEGWLVARKIYLPNEDTEKGFKFYKKEGNTETWKGGNCSALHKQFTPDGDGNIDFTHDKSYDIYYNPTDNKYFMANAGEDWNRTIYMMTDMELSAGTYYLHAWPHGGSGDITSTWPGNAGTTEIISGIKYYKFQIGIDNSPAGSYDCIFHTNEDTIRYDFRDGKLVLNDNDSAFYLCFTGNKYNDAIAEGNDNATYGDNTTNPMAQFTDPAKPEGSTNWNVYIGGRKAMQWEDGVLVAKTIEIGPSTAVKFLFDNDWHHYCGLASASGAVSPNTDFSVIVDNGSNAYSFTVPSLDDTYLCDVYLNVFNKTARVVPRSKSDAKVNIYIGVPNPGTGVKLYWYGKTDNGWPGEAMTYSETINGIKYYKYEFNGSFLWNSSVDLIVVSDGIEYGETLGFLDADWSGYKSEYWFCINERTISQLRGEPVFPSSIDGVFSDWLDLVGNDYTNGTTKHITTMKGYSDGTDLWLYLKLTPGTGTYTIDGWRYFRLYFDRDNSTGSGFNTSHWFYPGADEISTGIQNILVYYSKDGVDKAVVRNQGDSDTISGSSIKVVNNGSSGVEVELKMPLSAIGTITGNYINIYAVGTCGSEFDGKITGVYVPSSTE